MAPNVPEVVTLANPGVPITHCRYPSCPGNGRLKLDDQSFGRYMAMIHDVAEVFGSSDSQA